MFCSKICLGLLIIASVCLNLVCTDGMFIGLIHLQSYLFLLLQKLNRLKMTVFKW